MSTQVSVVGPKGEIKFPYLKRNLEGELLIAPLPDLQDSDYLTPSLLRQLCDRLKIPRADFGLQLD